MSTISPQVHLVGNFSPTRKHILSIILLDQNFNANDVDIMVFEPSALLPTAAVVWGRTENTPLLNKRLDELIECN